MTDTTTPAGADDRVSDEALAAAGELWLAVADALEGGSLTVGDVAATIQQHAITPALVRHQQAVDELWKMLNAAHSALRSYQYSNSSTELAESVADAAQTALAAHRPLVSQSQEKK